MDIAPLPSLDRTSATFKTDVDTFFASELPAFSVQVEAARVVIVSAESTASTAANTATTKAGIATTGASTATTQAGTATTQAGIATTAAAAAAASAASITAQVATAIHAASSKTTPVDPDEFGLADSAASFGLKKLTWANLKAALKTYLDDLYPSKADVLAQTYTAFTTGGANTAYTLTPSPAIAAYAVGQAFDITLHTAAGASPTININGLGATVNLVYRTAAGSYANINGLPVGVYRGVMVSTTQMMLDVPRGLLQRVPFVTSAPATGPTRFIVGTSMPTNTQGDQFMSQAFTAKSALSKIRLSVEMVFSGNTASNVGFAIFKDGVLVRAVAKYFATSNTLDCIQFSYEIPAADLSSHTYTVRAGLDTAGFTFSFNSTTFGGSSYSTLTIEEFLP